MLRPRLIPCLLMHKSELVKTQSFRAPKYVGDPINAVRIFNEKESDELMVLDIDATANRAGPNYGLIAKMANECRMPLCYGGGITTADQTSRIIDLGVEKVAVSAAAVENPRLLTQIANSIGRQSVVGIIDVRKTGFEFGKYGVWTHNARISHDLEPLSLAKTFEDAGAGEIVINSIDRDGQMNGYDLVLAELVRKIVNVPITIMGGAGSLKDIAALIHTCGIVGAAAGSLFVFKGQYRAVLINYPAVRQKDALFALALDLQSEKNFSV